MSGWIVPKTEIPGRSARSPISAGSACVPGDLGRTPKRSPRSRTGSSGPPPKPMLPPLVLRVTCGSVHRQRAFPDARKHADCGKNCSGRPTPSSGEVMQVKSRSPFLALEAWPEARLLSLGQEGGLSRFRGKAVLVGTGATKTDGKDKKGSKRPSEDVIFYNVIA